jgi:hypothetical protein
MADILWQVFILEKSIKFSIFVTLYDLFQEKRFTSFKDNFSNF